MPLTDRAEFRGTERFVVQRCLGAGAFGVVYQAFDRERGAAVALKTLREANAEALYRLKREFRALADIVHPNLVALHELLTEGEQWFFTMELVEGANFVDYVRRGFEPGLPDEPTSPALFEPSAAPAPVSRFAGRPDRLRAALRQAVLGLRALHAAGKLHRDIKPSNVLVTPEGRVVLLDFGLVAELIPSEVERSVSLVGTPAYMPPEQGSSLPLSEASDWYSLGVTLYEALTGTWPFCGTFLEMVWNKRHSDGPAPSGLVADVPEDLNALCRDLLRHEQQARPTGDEILARLGGVQSATFQSLASSTATTRTAPFVGRQAHLSALRSAFLASKEGRAVVVRLHGASGTGKTALARRFLDGLSREGVITLAGRCYERESVPYKALDSLVDSLSQYLKRLPSSEVEGILPRDVLALARLFPVLRRVEPIVGARRKVLEILDSQELRRRAFAALRELLTRLADRRDLVLFIDDLQWGDVDSAALLSELLRPPNPPALLLIACYRSEEAETSPFLQGFVASGNAAESLDVQELIVGGLTDLEARELACNLLGEDPSGFNDRADAIAREAGGNPFFISELARYSEAGVEFSEAYPNGRRISAGRPDGGTTLENLIRSRVERLPDPARRLLEVLAVAGQPLKATLAKNAAGLGDDEEDPLDLLRARHMIRTRTTQEGDEIEPYHDRIRETLVAHLPAEALKLDHQRLAVALEASGRADPETLALHFQEAGDFERAADYSASAAAHAAETLAFYRAARLYHAALDLSPRNGPAGRELRVRLADALTNSGRGAEAARVYLAASRGAPAADALELQRRAAEQFLISGHLEEGLSATRAVLARVGLKLAATPRRALFSMLLRRLFLRLRGIGFHRRDATQVSAEKLSRIDICGSVTIGLGFFDPVRGADFQARHLLLALRAGEPYRIARALAIEALTSSQAGGRTRRRTARLSETSLALARTIENPHAVGFATFAGGLAAFLEGEWSRARTLTETAEEILRERCQGVTWELDSTHYYSLLSLFYLGRLKELSEALPGMLKEAQDRGDLYAVTNIRTRLSCLITLAEDKPEETREQLLDAIASWTPRGFFLQHWYELHGQVECLLYEGEGREAWKKITGGWPLLKRSLFPRTTQYVRIQGPYLRARAALATAAEEERENERRALLHAAHRDARRIEREKMPWGNALALLLHAGVAAGRSETGQALRLLDSAERGFEAVDMALHAAAARRRRGELLGGDQGRVVVESADAWMVGQKIKNPNRMSAMLAPGPWL